MRRRLTLERLEMRRLLDAAGWQSGDSPAPASTSSWEASAEGETGTVKPDFQLVDVNPNSSTSQQQIAPSNYRGKVTAWYFAHST